MTANHIYHSPRGTVEIPALSVTEWVFQGLAKNADNPVFTESWSERSISGRDAEAMIRALGGALVAAGLKKGQVVAVMAPNSIDYFLLFHATALAGGALTMINPAYTANELAYQLRETASAFLFYAPDLEETAAQGVSETNVGQAVPLDVTSLCQFIKDQDAAPLAQQVPVNLAEDLAAIPFSSGTTGLPKGVMLTHQNLVANASQWGSIREFGPGDVSPIFLPFFHVFGLALCQLVYPGMGASVHLMQRFDLETFLRIAQDTGSQRLWVVPPIAIALAKSPIIDNFDLSAVTEIGCGAAPLSMEIGDAVRARLGCDFYQGFGMTELSGMSHSHAFGKSRKDTLGTQVANLTCRIADPETGQDLPPNQPGELWLKGPIVMKGYLNSPERTAEALVEDGWFRTGDICAIDADGHLTIHDRLKEMIKVKGFPVAPAEVEAALITHPAILEAAVIGVSDDERGEIPMAFLVLTNGADLGLEDVQAYLATKLAKYKIIGAMELVSEVPKAASGKILRRVLKDTYNRATQS